MDIENFSSRFQVRVLTEADVETVFALCRQNPLFYEHCPPFVTRESILEDMKALPPGKTPADKYYVGFFQEGHLVAILDLIDHSPAPGTAFVGFFMVDHAAQGQGLGTGIIRELTDCLKALGYDAIRLGWINDNPQSEHFWLKNGFVPILSTKNNGPYEVIIGEKKLST